MTRRRNAPNLMELHPRRTAAWDDDPGGIVVHAPRGRLLAFVSRKLGRSSHVRVKLDELGAFVWRRCDGSRTVYEITEEIELTFAEEDQPLMPRVVTFVNRLALDKLISLQPNTPDGD